VKATGALTTRGLKLGFLLVVILMTAGAGFSLLSAQRAARRIDGLVADSLEREQLIGLMRLDAALLVKAAGDYIDATTEAERQSADHAMGVILKEIQELSERFTAKVPKTEATLWVRLSDSAAQLVKKVDVTIKASNRRELERARQHLEEEAKPLSFEVDDTAATLAQTNSEETQRLLRELQATRVRASLAGAGAVALALLISLIVALQVTRTLSRQERVIAAQLHELNERNAELDAFASRVAHDLVAPLSPLKGYLTLARRQASDPQVKELLQQAESSTARMSELVEGLLRFCRAGKSTEKSAGELDTAVSTILLEQSQAAHAGGVGLARALAPVRVSCPPQLLQSIAQNVLSNAVKYTQGRPAAQVSVRVEAQAAEGVLTVTDNGPGMSEASLGKLFQPFFRAAETRAVPGTGLGLATTRRLVEAHGGTIAVTSAVGQGTTVTVRLPLAEEKKDT
jgi:signal transduction histidine kinase